ncbi:MAG: isoprenylcysteine carboxylmethyltransferase family protein [Neisseria sp.]|nr:isoprenylcysteine carboxylmethyltransferase family protein [Neisseria sp.]
MNALELKVPPLVVAAVCALLTWLTAVALPALGRPYPVLRVLALLSALAGLMLVFSAIALFVRMRTTVHPHRPTESRRLVTGGVYRFSRNPMYLAMAAWLLAWILWLGSWPGLLWLAVFAGYITRFQILPEERVLAAKFGRRYERYCRRARRWF